MTTDSLFDLLAARLSTIIEAALDPEIEMMIEDLEDLEDRCDTVGWLLESEMSEYN